MHAYKNNLSLSTNLVILIAVFEVVGKLLDINGCARYTADFVDDY